MNRREVFAVYSPDPYTYNALNIVRSRSSCSGFITHHNKISILFYNCRQTHPDHY